MADVGQAHAGHLQRTLAGQPHGRARMEVLAVERIPEVRGVGAAVQIDEFVLRHAELTGGLQAGDQHAGRLVDLHDGVQVLGVGEADHAVAVGHLDQLLRRTLDWEPGFRVLRRDLGERCEQLAKPLLVVGDRASVSRSQRVLEQRVAVDGPAQAVLGLIGRDARPRIADPFRLRQLLGVVPVGEAQALGQPLGGRAEKLAPDHQGQVGLALGDALADDVDQLLGAVAAHVGIDGVPRLRADALGQGRRRIGRVRHQPPAPRRVDREADHRQGIDLRELFRIEAGVLRGAFRRNLQQCRRGRRRRRIAPIGELARSDENWGPLVHHFPPLGD